MQNIRKCYLLQAYPGEGQSYRNVAPSYGYMSKNVSRCRAQSNEYEVGTLVVDGLAVTFGTARRVLGGTSPPFPLLAVPNV